MSLRCSTYPGEVEARQAIRALKEAGVPPAHIRLVTSRCIHDVRSEPVGGFAGPIPPEAPVGKYAGPARRRRQAAGGWVGDPDRQRQGTFADADLGAHAIYERGPRRSPLRTDREIWRLLREAPMPEGAVDLLLVELHGGHAVVLAETDVEARGLAAEDHE
jgi:hypothetical protein